MKKCVFLLAAVGSLTSFAFGATNDVEKRLDAATTVLNEMLGGPSDKGVPQELLEQAQCVVVVPGLKKAGFIVGGKYGKGFAACRKPGGAGWTAPAAVRIEGGSFGFQIGASETDVILIVRNQSGMNKLLQDKFTIGAGAEVTAGPVGRDLSAQTDAQMHAEILSYSRSRGVFAGLTLSGATLREDKEDNLALYGHAITNKEILSGAVPPPPVAEKFEATLARYSMRKTG
jgi:lipid-binding SYLF domain-containing protein